MRKATVAILGFCAFVCASVQAAAGPFSLQGESRWIALASRQSLDEAIGVARTYRWRFPSVRVMQASNGWYAIVIGPARVGNARLFKETLLRQGGLPKDLLFSRGDAYVTSVWAAPEPRFLAKASFDGIRPVAMEVGDLRVVIGRVKDTGGTDYVPLAVGMQGGKRVFAMTLDDSTHEDPKAEAMAIRLDSGTSAPQIVFTSYTRGAHCCTVTKIATQAGGAWRILEAKRLDGEGYSFEDIDQDGVFELVNADNRFYYAFAPYASSRTPIEITSLIGGRLVDVSGDGRFRSFQRQQVYSLEHEASLDTSLWSSNGFLAAWVAGKALVGEIADAWPRMLASYDRNSDWRMTECTVATTGSCPAGRERRLDFPEALRKLLETAGYIGSSAPSAAAAPRPPAQTAVTAPPVASPPPSKPADKGPSTGTGFFVTRDGHAVTNAHVVDGCTAIEIKTRDGVLPARLVSSDKTNDLALLKIDTEAKAVATLKSGVRLGESVAAFGFPLNTVLASAGNFTIGNVTALAGLGDDSRYLQISTPVQPGNSGGPLLDENGNVVGVVTAKLNALMTAVATGDVPQNVNFAIKASTLSIFLESSRVPLQAEIREMRLSTPDLADAANAMSLFVRCR